MGGLRWVNYDTVPDGLYAMDLNHGAKICLRISQHETRGITLYDHQGNFVYIQK